MIETTSELTKLDGGVDGPFNEIDWKLLFERVVAESNDRVRAALEAAAAVADAMREKHGSPTGDQYSCGVWDQGVRIAGKIREIDPKSIALSRKQGD